MSWVIQGGMFILFAAVVVGSLVAPMALAQESDNAEDTDEAIPLWDREYVGLQLKTWAVIIAVIIVVSVILEGLGWLLVLAGIGYVLWLLLT